MKSTGIPGVALAIVHGDQIVHMQGFGVADSSGRPVTPQTPMMLASLNKPIIGVAIMQLVESGRLALDAPVQQYLSYFRVADEAASAQITVRHLLQHTSGLPEKAGAENAWVKDDSPGALEARVRELSTIQLISAPGADYHYANPNYQTLALLIQQVSGQSYEAYMQEHVFAPLDMRQTFTSPEAAQPHGLAQGHRFIFGRPWPFVEPYDRGLAGLTGSAEDVAHFLIVNLNDGRYGGAQVLSAASLAEMHRPAVPVGDEIVAFDWFVYSSNGMTELRKGGDLASYKTNMALFLEDKWGFVVLINANDRFASRFGDLRVAGLAIGVNSLMFGQQPPNLAGNAPLVLRVFVALVAAVQLTGIVRSAMAFGRWRRQPGHSPQGPWGQARHIGLPLMVNLVWGLLLLAGVPALIGGFPLSFLQYLTPELGYFLTVSGWGALIWGSLRTVLAYLVLRGARPDAPTIAGDQASALPA
jgi:CubicO group peptidase (beta-lactamase class C family)